MEFRNPTEFARFISANELSRLDSTFVQLINCINNYSVECNCFRKEDKAKLYAVCSKLYLDGARHIAPRYKNDLLSKTTDRQISLYTESGQLIVIISR